jgi:hypothetical protein
VSRLGILLVSALVTVAACSDLSPASELSRARARWQERGLASYRITIRRECECLDRDIGPFVVSVRSGSAEWIAYRTDTTFVDAGDRVPTVEELFRMIDEALQGGAQIVEARYDRALGYPLMVYINEDPSIPDGNVRTVVMSLVAQ